MSFVKSIFNFLRFNKKNWKAVVLCLFAATVFWFFNALNKSYATNISFPVTFEFDQERYIPVKPLPTTVRMNVTGTGWDLFRRSSGFKIPPLVIPLEKPTEIKRIVGTTLPALFASQLEKLQINFVITDTVRISMEEKVKRKFRVSLDSVNQYIDADFGLGSAVRLTPDTLWLEGPREIIKELPETLTIKLAENNIRKDFNEDVEPTFRHKHLIIPTPQRINVSFEVVKFRQVDKRIKLSIINIPVRLKVDNGIVKEVNCSYKLASTSTFSGDSLIAVIDLKNTPRGTRKLVPEILGLPANAKLIKADTVLVNF